MGFLVGEMICSEGGASDIVGSGFGKLQWQDFDRRHANNPFNMRSGSGAHVHHICPKRPTAATQTLKPELRIWNKISPEFETPNSTIAS